MRIGIQTTLFVYCLGAFLHTPQAIDSLALPGNVTDPNPLPQEGEILKPRIPFAKVKKWHDPNFRRQCILRGRFHRFPWQDTCPEMNKRCNGIYNWDQWCSRYRNNPRGRSWMFEKQELFNFKCPGRMFCVRVKRDDFTRFVSDFGPDPDFITSVRCAALHADEMDMMPPEVIRAWRGRRVKAPQGSSKGVVKWTLSGDTSDVNYHMQVAGGSGGNAEGLEVIEDVHFCNGTQKGTAHGLTAAFEIAQNVPEPYYQLAIKFDGNGTHRNTLMGLAKWSFL